MPSRHDAEDCLEGIVENAERIAQYLAGLDHDTFAANGLVRDAIGRCIEPVCEAGYPRGYRASELMPNQNWADIGGT